MKTKWEEPKKQLNTTNNALREKSGKENILKLTLLHKCMLKSGIPIRYRLINKLAMF